MNLDIKVNISIGDDVTKIELIDKLSALHFLEIEITNNDFMFALGRRGIIPAANCIIRNIENVGKQLLIGKMEVEIPKRDKKIAYQECLKVCPDGWIVDKYFSTQTSFRYEDKKIFAVATIRKYE